MRARIVETVAHQHRGKLGTYVVEQGQVAGFGDQQLTIGVSGIVQELFATTRVIESHDCGTDQPGTTERKQILGCVVEQHCNVGGPFEIEALQEQIRVAT